MLWSSDRNLDILSAKTFPGSFHQNADDEDVATEGTPPKVVLYWTKYYEAADFGFGLGRKPFIRASCKVTNCIATNDHSMVDKSDAILFHGGQFNYSDIPDHRLPCNILM
jgi:Fucosyltransferase, N-terminal